MLQKIIPLRLWTIEKNIRMKGIQYRPQVLCNTIRLCKNFQVEYKFRRTCALTGKNLSCARIIQFCLINS